MLIQVGVSSAVMAPPIKRSAHTGGAVHSRWGISQRNIQQTNDVRWNFTSSFNVHKTTDKRHRTFTSASFLASGDFLSPTCG